ncbi:hypothetical protein ACETK8_15885 [Brevundimonas staleyi]|uniref:Uncharacterized protein n=1 Tax=Brevundimonas staleyi TaxID=74326 RepID=A0ABW0FX29_9CAUL
MSVLDVFAIRMAGSIADPMMLVLLALPGLLAKTWRMRVIAAAVWTLFATLIRLDSGVLELDASAATFAAAMLYQLALWFIWELVTGGLSEKRTKGPTPLA